MFYKSIQHRAKSRRAYGGGAQRQMPPSETDSATRCVSVMHLEAASVLVLSARPGDEVFGCGGAVGSHVARGIPVKVIVVSDTLGDAGQDLGLDRVRGRRRESRAASQQLGYPAPVFWGCRCNVLRYGERLIANLLDAIVRADADIVYAPSPDENDMIRRALGMATAEAVRRRASGIRLAWYEIDSPLRPNLLFDISDGIAGKLAAMACFASLGIRSGSEPGIVSLNRYRAACLPAGAAAEAYILVKAEELATGFIDFFPCEYDRWSDFDHSLSQPGRALVSVIVRSMDRRTLPDALDSIALQTYSNLEVVVVNAAGEGHRELGPWCGRFPLRLISAERPLRRSAAANLGIDSAQGQYFIFLDDDDLFDPNHIASLVDALEGSPKCLAAYAGVKVEDSAGNRIGVYHEPFSSARFMAGNFIPIHAILFARQLVSDGCRFDDRFDSYEDWDFWLQVARCTTFVRTATISAVYRAQLGDSGMALPEADQRERQRQARLAVWAKWWPRWTVDDFDLLVENHREQMVSVQQELGEAVGIATDLRRQLVECDALIAERDTLIAARDGTIAALAHDLAQKGQEIDALNHLAVQRGQQIDAISGQLESSHGLVAEREAQIAELHRIINEILNSTSWKLTAPVRSLKMEGARLGKALGSGHAAFRTALRYVRSGSVVRILRRTAVILRTEGLQGIRARLRILETVYRHIDAPPLQAKSGITLEKHDFAPLASIDIERYEFFFLDVFDTAIIRLFQAPVDLFEYLGIRAKDPDFARRRVQQEAEARRRHPRRKDIDIREIYRDLTGSGMEDEIAAELQFCVVNPEVHAFYSQLIEAGKKIYFVSDMYLDQGTVAAILEKNGFSGYEGIYVSSQDDLIKGDGSRFEWLKRSLPECVGHAIHIGDNRIADYAQPRAHGFDALHYIEADAWFRHDPFLYSKIAALNSHRSVGISFLLGAFRYWKAGFSDERTDYWRQFGFFYGGALISAFCGFISEQIAQRNLACTKIFFLARDGDIMSRVYRMFHDDIPAVYLLASRRCMSFPSFRSLTDPSDGEMLKLFTTPIGVAGAYDVMERFHYRDLHALEKDLRKLDSDASRWTDADIRACIVNNRQAVMEKVLAERQVLLDYLSEIGFFADEDIVLIDVGWGGTIQNGLLAMLELSGRPQHRVHGFYLGVNASVAHQERKMGFLFDGDQTAFAPYLNLIELLTSSPQDGIIRIERTGDGFVPVTAEAGTKEKQRQIVAAEIQKGIIDFAQLLKERHLRALDLFYPEDFRVLFASLQQYASDEDTFHLSQLRHAMALGNNFHQPVLSNC